MTSTAKTVGEYLAALPPDRRTAISAVRDIILTNLPKGYEEVMQYGMISYVVPHSIYPAGYHCKPSEPLPYALLGSQKNHMAIKKLRPGFAKPTRRPARSWIWESLACVSKGSTNFHSA